MWLHGKATSLYEPWFHLKILGVGLKAIWAPPSSDSWSMNAVHLQVSYTRAWVGPQDTLSYQEIQAGVEIKALREAWWANTENRGVKYCQGVFLLSLEIKNTMDSAQNFISLETEEYWKTWLHNLHPEHSIPPTVWETLAQICCLFSYSFCLTFILLSSSV